MSWVELDFGRYKGKTLPQVLFVDPDWFFWAMEEGVFTGRGELHDQAMLLKDRATRMRVPSRFGPDVVAEYRVNLTVMKFAGVQIVLKSKLADEEDSPTLRSPVLDFSAPRRIAPYDKAGGEAPDPGSESDPV